MIDTHAHLDFEAYDKDRAEVVARFFEQGGKAIVNVGVDKERNQKALELAQYYENIYATVGYHPTDAIEVSEEDIKKDIEAKVQYQKIVAIGEIGLDYFHLEKEEDKTPQKKLFELQLDLAKKYAKPVIIHCRDAYEDVLEIISKADYRDLNMVIHCYGGGAAVTKKFLELSKVMFSFTGNITYAKGNDQMHEVIKLLPMERIMVETDCPFLAPIPHRGKRNEPLYVEQVIEKLAEIRGISASEVENVTDNNAVRFFGLEM